MASSALVTGLESLPPELLARILSCQPSGSDLKQAASVCKLWYDVVSHTRELAPNRIALDLKGDLDLQLAQPFIVANSLGQTRHQILGKENLRLTDLSLSYEALRWNGPLAQLRSLQLVRVDLSPKDLSLVLLQCHSLRELGLVSLRDAFLPGNFLEDESVVETLATHVLAKVWKLDLSVNQYLTDVLFSRILAAVPAVTHLSLRNCKIQNHSGIYKKFYPASVEGAPSPSVFTFRHVLSVLEKRSRILEELDLYNTGLDGPAVQDLANLEGLSLTGIDLGKCSLITQQSVLELVKKQPRLKKLRLDFCRRVLVDSPATSMQIFEELGDTLDDLSLRGLSIPRDFDTLLAHSDGLKELRCCDLDVSGETMANSIKETKMRRTLRSLSLNNFVANPRHFVSMFSFPSPCRLTSLELRNCQTGITDPVLQAISQNMTFLRHLDISFCRRLTDSGFTGAKVPNEAEEGEASTSDGRKVFLGGQGEREVLKEAEQRARTEVLLVASTPDASSCSSIDNLKHLNSLLVSSVVLLSHAPLQLSFHFCDLRVLDLSICPEIGDAGFSLLGKKNPHLEVFRAKRCSIGDEGLEGIISWTKRLVELDIESCKGVTSKSVLKLSDYCPMLKKLNVSYCLRVRLFAVAQLIQELPFLRNEAVGVLGLHIAEAMEEEEEGQF